MKWNKSLLVKLPLCIALLSIAGCDQMGLSQQKIAYVNMAKILETSPIGKQEQEWGEKVKDVLVKASTDAQATYANIPADQQQKAREADAMTLNRQWDIERSSARVKSVKAIVAVVETYRTGNKIDLVLDSSQVVASNPANDISQQIITQLANTRVDYGKLPEVVVNKQMGKTEIEPKNMEPK
ncbi:OmpH family outer membrane protein [Buttiauxella ferragutiae]|nr:OmpH family outer membrane protein [Buttiauxella ferragutiae]